MRHGARSRTAIQKRASEVRAELGELLTEHLPHLGPGDQPLIELAVDVVSKLRLVNEHLDRTSGGSLVDMRGRPRRLLGAVPRSEPSGARHIQRAR
jgi:hypothetical protein